MNVTQGLSGCGRWWRCAMLISLGLLAGFSARAQDPQSDTRYLSMAVGHVAILDGNVEDPGVLKIEYRFGPFSRWQLHPAIGTAHNEGGAMFLFTFLERDFPLNKHWVLSANFGMGTFRDGDKIRLGSSLEFRSGIKMAFQFDNAVRLGLGFFHLSNAGIGRTNPGTEPLFVHIAFPLDGRAR